MSIHDRIRRLEAQAGRGKRVCLTRIGDEPESEVIRRHETQFGVTLDPSCIHWVQICFTEYGSEKESDH
jgi:hypothetical protein